MTCVCNISGSTGQAECTLGYRLSEDARKDTTFNFPLSIVDLKYSSFAEVVFFATSILITKDAKPTLSTKKIFVIAISLRRGNSRRQRSMRIFLCPRQFSAPSPAFSRPEPAPLRAFCTASLLQTHPLDTPTYAIAQNGLHTDQFAQTLGASTLQRGW